MRAFKVNYLQALPTFKSCCRDAGHGDSHIIFVLPALSSTWGSLDLQVTEERKHRSVNPRPGSTAWVWAGRRRWSSGDATRVPPTELPWLSGELCWLQQGRTEKVLDGSFQELAFILPLEQQQISNWAYLVEHFYGALSCCTKGLVGAAVFPPHPQKNCLTKSFGWRFLLTSVSASHSSSNPSLCLCTAVI